MEKTLDELYCERDFTTIVQRFDRFLGRYKEIFNPRAPTRKIIGLTKSSNDLYRTVRYLTHSGSASEIHQMRTSIMDTFGEEELTQVIYLAFMEVLNKYDPTREVPLEKFIYNYYPYLLTAEINNLAGPKQLLNDTAMQSYNKISNYNDNIEIEETEEFSNNFEDLVDGIELDDNWIEGSSCTEPFNCLTQLERKLLVMIFVDKKTHEEIARDMRYHFSSIKRKKNEIMLKLAERLLELEEEENACKMY
jgi:hypothetical protein